MTPVAWLAIAALAVRLHASEPVLVPGAQVRVMVSSIGPGWHDGTVGEAVGGCTVVNVAAEHAPKGRLAVFLHSIERLQVPERAGGSAPR